MAGEVEIILKATDQAGATLKKVGGDLRGFGDEAEKSGKKGMLSAQNLDKAFKGLAKGGALALVGALKYSIDQAAEAQVVMAQTEAVIKSTGGAAGISAGQISDLAESLSNLSTFDDESIQKTANVLLTFTNIKGEQFEGATQAILDMSAALGTDLQGAAIQVGKALNDPVQGISALQRVGVSFTQSQKDVIKAMAETGDIAGAQQLIMDELNKEFGGSAAAQLDTYAGKMLQLKNNVDNLAESLGTKLIPFLSQAAENANAIVIGVPAIGAAYREHETVVLRTADSYAEFKEEMLRARAVAGPLAGLMGWITEAEFENAQAAAQAAHHTTQYASRSRDLADSLPQASVNMDAWALSWRGVADAMEAAGQAAEDRRLADLAGRLDALHASMQPFTIDVENAAPALFAMAESAGIGVGVLEKFAVNQGLIVPETVRLNEAMTALAVPMGELTDMKQAAGLEAINQAVTEGADPVLALRDAISEINYGMGLLAPAWTGAASSISSKAPGVQASVDNLAGSVGSAKAQLLGFKLMWDALQSKTINLNMNTIGGGGPRQSGGLVAGGVPYQMHAGEVYVPQAGGGYVQNNFNVTNNIGGALDMESAMRRLFEMVRRD